MLGSPGVSLISEQSHQNKFHADSIRDLTAKFSNMKEGDIVSNAEKELWEYFSTLYRNSNKGIKGRGKDRRMFTVTKSKKDLKEEDEARKCEE